MDRKSQRCGSIQAGCTKSKAYERTNIKSFASLYKDCGGSMGVRVFSEHRCEAAAPTEPAGETQRPPVADHSRPKEVPLGYGEIP